MRHIVKKGECISSIAFLYGFAPDTLWERNPELRRKRSSPNLLVENDEVVIPEKREKWMTIATGRSHRFKRRAVPERFVARFLDWSGKPRASLPYRFVVNGETREGATDGDGRIREWIPPDTDQAEIELGEGGERMTVTLGRLPPIDEPGGVLTRLHNLGYPGGEHEDDDATRAAVRSFQSDSGLAATGAIDDATRAKLREIYCV